MFNGNKVYKIDKNGKRHRILGLIFGLKISFKGKNSIVELHEPLSKFNRCKIKVKDNSRISIGSCGKIKKLQILACSEQTITIGNNFITRDCEIAIGSEKSLNVSIGDDCLFAKNIMIRASDGHSIIDNYTKEVLNPGKDIKVGNRVWMAGNIAVLKGVTIGDNCVIGNGSTVTHDCQNNSVYAGVPAKLVRKDISWTDRLHPLT